MKKLLIIALLLITTGCDSWLVREEKTIVTETNTEYLVPEVNIDSYLLEDCKDLKLLETTTNLNEAISDILINVKDNTIIYNECKAKHKSLVELLKRSLNLGDK